MLHNLALTIISGGLLALFIEQLLPTVWRHGIFFAICDERGGWTEKLVTLYYVRIRHPGHMLLLTVLSSITLQNTWSSLIPSSSY